MKKKWYAFICLLTLSSAGISAQEAAENKCTFYVGGGLGLYVGSMRVSGLDESEFPSSKGSTSAVYSLFVQGEFGRQKNYVVRPQLSFLTRGGSLTDIGNGYGGSGVDDVFYRVKAHYVDFRIPVLYQFGKAGSKVRPYAGLTPILGFATGGDIRLQEDYKDFSYVGYQVDLNKSNFAPVYFAFAPTVGVRFNFHTGSQAQNILFVGLEASYQIGLTDTYGSDEKNGKAKDVVNGYKFQYAGTRKFSGFELQATVGIPFSAFRRAKAAPKTEPAPVVQVIAPKPVEQPKPKAEEKPCYTLEEITEMINSNKSVVGKTICAVDAINFDFGKSTIKRESHEYLDRLAETLMHTNSSVVVKGHTDNVGSDDFNMNLSKKRAEAVVKYLVGKGIPKDRLSYEYYGASRPIKDNDTEEGRTYNRRVEFEIQK